MSRIEVTGVCLRQPGPSCAGRTAWRNEGFELPEAAPATLVATWDPACDGCRTVRVHVAGAAAEGESPLVLDLGTLPAGEHVVGVWFGGDVVGQVRQDVRRVVSYG